MAIKKVKYLLLCIGSIIFSGCSQNSVNEGSAADGANIGLIRLTESQLNQADIKTGKIRKDLITDIIYCNGTIEANPNRHAYVSAPINGYMKKIVVHIGEYVNKGEVLAILEHPDYIDLQREFLETKSQYNYYKEDFKRQGELSLENATSLKKMQLAENEFRKIEARYFALKEHLEFIGINTDSLYVDRIQSYILLKAPISGYITQSDGKIGQLCTTEIVIFQIISNTDALLHLKVFESDAWKVEKGQSLEFNAINNQDKQYTALITATTKSVDENNAINIHARIIDRDENLLPGMYVKAKIILNADSVFTLVNPAIVKYNNENYIFIKKDSTGFKFRVIQTGRTNTKITEILQVDSEMLESEIVTSGAYYLQAERTKEE